MTKLTVDFRKFAIIIMIIYKCCVCYNVCNVNKKKLKWITSRQQDWFSYKIIDTILSKLQTNLCYKYWNKNKLGKMNHIETAAVSKQHNRVFWEDIKANVDGSFLAAFSKLWKATISLGLSVCLLSLWNNLASNETIFKKFDIWGFFFQNSVMKIKVPLKYDKKNGTVVAG